MNPFDNFAESFGGYLPNILAAILILIVGWIVAKIVANLVGGLLRRTNLDERLARAMSNDPNASSDRFPVDRWVSTIVFWVIMLFAIVGFLQVLNLAIVSGPLNNLLDQILGFIPGLLSAAVLLFVAWLVATLLRTVIVRLLGASSFSRRMSENAQMRSQDRVTIGETIGNIVYWLVFLLFLPAILGALNLQGILAPVQNMVNEVLAALPNILAAAVILGLGYLVARIIRQIVTGLLAGVGVDRIGSDAGVPEQGRVRLSNVIGTVVYVLILIPVAIAALNALNIPAISNPAAAMLTTLLNALPIVFGAILLLALAYFIARILGNFVSGILSNLGFDGLFRSMGMYRGGIPNTGTAGVDASQPGTDTWTPSRIIGTFVTVAVVLFAAVAAANMLGFELLATMVSEFIVLAGNILLGLLILGLGLYLASLADRAIRGSGARQANVLATTARAAIIVFTGALALRQMGIGEDIVNLAFGLLLGAIAVAAALAFGLGGRDVAAQQLERWRRNMESSGGSIPQTGKSLGESFRDELNRDIDRASSRKPESGASGQPGGIIPETGSSMGMEGLHDRPERGESPEADLWVDSESGTIPETGSGFSTEGEEDLDSDYGVSRREVDDEDTGTIPNTGNDLGTTYGSSRQRGSDYDRPSDVDYGSGRKTGSDFEDEDEGDTPPPLERM